MYKRICITCKYLWRVWQCSIVAQSLKNLWGQRESAFEEGTCACFLATLGQRVTHFVRRQGEFEVLLEVHQPIEDAPNSGKARPAVSTIEHRGVVHGEKKAIQVNLGQSAKQVVEAEVARLHVVEHACEGVPPFMDAVRSDCASFTKYAGSDVSGFHL